MRKLKEIQAAAEKIRREKWIDEKTKKIKVRTTFKPIVTAAIQFCTVNTMYKHITNLCLRRGC